MIDHQAIVDLTKRLYVARIQQAFGDRGLNALERLLYFLPTFYRHVDTSYFVGPLVIFQTLESGSLSALPDGVRFARTIEELAQSSSSLSLIEIKEQGFNYWINTSIDVVTLSDVALVYCFNDGPERFVIHGADCLTPQVETTQSSVFARPSFGGLLEALGQYRARVRSSSCMLFSKAWEDESRRLFFRSKPEKYMRKSLHQYLDTVLRDAEVRPEQNVDETHPVDVKVSWLFTTNIALIEIKWLGSSRKDGRLTSYTASRAREGAKQLSDYLDENRTFAPKNLTKGYLVVFDARRRGLKPESVSTTRTDGYYYENAEIDYDPEFHKTRDDFEEPIRLFCEPICSTDDHADEDR